LPHLFRALQGHSIELMVHLQPLVVDSAASLGHMSQVAFDQTTDLCWKAQNDLKSLRAVSTVHLCTFQDSYVR
jgi:hypothetical protein